MILFYYFLLITLPTLYVYVPFNYINNNKFFYKMDSTNILNKLFIFNTTTFSFILAELYYVHVVYKIIKLEWFQFPWFFESN